MLKKLILFDIDGTIMSSGKGAVKALKLAINLHVRKIPEIGYKDTAGKTDRLIINTILKRQGVPEAQIPEMINAVSKTYLDILPALYNAENDARLFPGSKSLIKKLHKRGDAALGLITGNVEKGARIKLNPFDLNDYFLFGAFGSDAMYRDELPSIAASRAKEIHDREFRGEDIVIIGDTVYDVTCGRSLGARAIAVVRREEFRSAIEQANPFYICNGFDNKEQIINHIFK